MDAHNDCEYRSPSDSRVESSLRRLALLAELDESIRSAVLAMADSASFAAGWLLADEPEDDEPATIPMPPPPNLRLVHREDTVHFIRTATQEELTFLSEHMLARLGELSDAEKLAYE